MNAEKVISFGFLPYFEAISLILSLSAAICGAALIFASSYEITPDCSHILIVFSISVCFIYLNFKVSPPFFKGAV